MKSLNGQSCSSLVGSDCDTAKKSPDHSQGQEFWKGDLVTFHAYKGERIQAKVINSVFGYGWSKEWKYHLEGVDTPLMSITSGRCIEESKFYRPPP